MPVYEYKCTEGHRYHLFTEMDDSDSREFYEGMDCWLAADTAGEATDPEDMCWEPLKRVYSFAAAPVMHEHFNHSVGKVISDMRQFKSQLARKSEEDSERRGMKIDYQPVDLTDRQSLGVTDEGIETYDRSYARAAGRASRDEDGTHSRAMHPSNPERTVLWLPPLTPPAPSAS